MASYVTPVGAIRKLWASERDAYLAHLLRLDPVGRRNRFGVAVSDEFLRDYTDKTFGTGDIVFGFVEDGMVRGAAELRGLEDHTTDFAEAAFSVEEKWRRRGIGEALFHSLINAARNRGHGRLFMTCLRSNTAMQGLARKFNAKLKPESEDVECLLDAGGATPLSVLEEAVEDAQGLATMTLDLQRRFWGKALGLVGSAPAA